MTSFAQRVNEISRSPPLCTIKMSDLELKLEGENQNTVVATGGDDYALLRDYRQIASYNWSGTPANPEIVVPGAPKAYVQWRGGRLNRDPDVLMADENHYMMPDYPLEPLFQAVKILMCSESESFKFQDFDIVTDRNNLRKLFGFVQDESKMNPYREANPIRIDVQCIGRLVCLIRCQEADAELASNRRYPTFGKDFEHRCSRSGNDYSNGSFRQIVTYKLGNLKFLVRFEVDCADYEKSAKESSEPVESIMKKISLSGAKSDQLPGSKLSCLHFGQKRDYYHLVELKTKSDSTSFPDFVWPQMFFSNTQSLVIGWHSRGHVKRVSCYSLKDVEKEYGGFPRENMLRFCCLMEKIVKFARGEQKTDDDGKNPQQRIYSLIWKPGFGDEIRLYAPDPKLAQSAVPDELYNFIAKN